MPGDRRLRSVLRGVRVGCLLQARVAVVVAVGAVGAVTAVSAAPRSIDAGPVTPQSQSLSPPSSRRPAPHLLPVPFLPQTEALCGGAAAAMLFRFYGDRHADVQEFAALVDRRHGGIPADRLAGAIAARGWTTTVTAGTRALLRDSLASARPVMLLVEVRPSRYHFIVAVGADEAHVYVHDPTWGPGRAIAWSDLDRAWQAAGNWMLAVSPDPDRRPQASAPAPAPSGVPPVRRAPDGAGQSRAAGATSPAPACDDATDAAVSAVQSQGLDSADRLLGAVRAACPRSSRPVSELAAIRFAQRRYDAAIDLARTAVALDAHDAYAWDVLASSRFVQDDVAGALAAWNAIARPQLDLVTIEGLARVRYAFVAEWLSLRQGRTITPEAFARADRRLRALPGLERAGLRLIPSEDGWSEVTAAVVERDRLPHGLPSWVGRVTHAAIGRELAIDVPGWTGQGEAWSGSWRWWDNRPRVAFGLAMPTTGTIRGVWELTASWRAQTFATARDAPPARDTQRHAGISLSDWVRPHLHYALHAGFDAWDGSSSLAPTRTVSAGITLDQRWAGDRLSMRAEGHTWWPVGVRRPTGGDATRRFESVDVRLAARTRSQERGLVTLVAARAQAVSAATPRLLWPGAGDVYSTSPPLRAHPLTARGIVDSPAFGRRLLSGSIEQRRWFAAGPLVRVGVAGFVDAARAARGDGREGTDRRGPLVVDAGVGLRIRLAGRDDLVRVDVGRGLRDGATVVQVGWGQ